MNENGQDYGEYLLEILKVLQKKYNHMSEVSRLTSEMSRELQRDDKVTVQMILGMRGEEIDAVKASDRQLYLLRESAPDELKDWLGQAMDGKMAQSERYGKEQNMVIRVASNIRRVWEKTMETDRYMSKRLAGNDSFYAGR